MLYAVEFQVILQLPSVVSLLATEQVNVLCNLGVCRSEFLWEILLS
jgi:hypothetical protein